MDKTLKQKIDFYASQFEAKTRDNENKTQFIILKDDAPDELRDAVCAVHDDRLPDDYIYSWFSEILDTLSGYTIDGTNDIDENRAEIVDMIVDPYTAGLTAWLASNVNNVYYMDEAQKEYGQAENGFKLLAMAQYMAIDEVFAVVYDLLMK